MIQTKEVNILEVFEQMEERKKKAAELRRQFESEASSVEQKFRGILEEYRPACEELQYTIDEFHKKWDPLMADYNRETTSLRKKYKRLVNSL